MNISPEYINYGSVILGGVFFLLALMCPSRKQKMMLNLELKKIGHILILGQTGTGKTVSGFSQILHLYCKQYKNWGGMLLGVKNDEHLLVNDHLNNTGRIKSLKLLQVRPASESENWMPPLRMNIIGDRRLPWGVYASLLVDAGKALEGESGNKFFVQEAERIFSSVMELLDRLDESVTIKSVYDVITQPDLLDNKCRKILDLEDYSDQDFIVANYLSTTLLSDDAKEQLKGTISSTQQYLSHFLDTDISKVFCSETPNVHIQDMDFGKVLATSIPQTHLKARKYIHNVLKSLFYYHSVLRFDKKAENPKYKNPNRLLLLVDEAQDVISGSETGLGDHGMADRLRSADVRLVFAMQSEESPVRLKAEQRKNLRNHFNTRLVFQQGEYGDAENLSKLIGKEKFRKVSKSYSRRTGSSRSISIQEDWVIPPSCFMSLLDHQCVVMSKGKRKFRIINLAPINGEGKIMKWFRPASLRAAKKHLKRN